MNVVIGGGSGIGAAVVPLLSGSTLVADRVGTEVVCDVTDPASVAALVARVDRLRRPRRRRQRGGSHRGLKPPGDDVGRFSSAI